MPYYPHRKEGDIGRYRPIMEPFHLLAQISEPSSLESIRNGAQTIAAYFKVYALSKNESLIIIIPLVLVPTNWFSGLMFLDFDSM